MVSDILLRDLKNSSGKKGVLYTKNGFRFEVKFLDCDDEFLKVADLKKLYTKYFRLSEIENLEVLE